MNITLRPVKSDDMGFLFNLHKATLKSYVEQLWGWDEDWQRRYHQENFRIHDLQIIQCGQQDIGVLSVIDRDGYIFLRLIEILPEYQGQGIGTRIIRHVTERAIAEQKPITLNVFKINPAHRLYQQLGFQIVGETEAQYTMRWERDFQT